VRALGHRTALPAPDQSYPCPLIAVRRSTGCTVPIATVAGPRG